MTGPIRLACFLCDREDCDGVDAVPANWEDVERVQSLAEACHTVHFLDHTRSVMAWWTHLGTCPECALSERRRYEQLNSA